jgi:uncharacterized protein (UPF0262 family)
MVFNVLLVEETGENQRPVASHWQILSHNVVSSKPRHDRGFELTTLVVMGTVYKGSCKSIYHAITTTTAPHIQTISRLTTLVVIGTDYTGSCKSVYHAITMAPHVQTISWLTTLVVIDTDYTGSCKSNYHAITTTTAPHIQSIACLFLLQVQRFNFIRDLYNQGRRSSRTTRLSKNWHRSHGKC